MKRISQITSLLALTLLTACSQNTVETATDKAAQTAEKAIERTEVLAEKTVAADQDISAIPSGAYVSESGHAYIAFTYSHQGYSRPIVHLRGFEAALNLDNAAPANSTLSVEIDPASLDSGVEKFDDHMKGGDMFEIETYPNITFKSTSMGQISGTNGTVTGDLTMHGVTKPVTLDVTLNKVGESRKKNPMFGISATGQIKRSDWGIGYAVPHVGDEVDLMIEVEFQKAE